MGESAPTIVWEPQPRQADAISCPAFEVFYGGAKGGGKSDFLIGDYLAHYEEWGEAWKGILFRRSYKELDEIVGRSKQIIGKIPGATYVGGDQMLWKIPAPNARYPGMATLRFRSLESDLDLGKYNGHQYPWIGFDELTEFPNQGPYIFMLSCCRSADGAPCFARATGNPGRPGHVWVKARFVDVSNPFDVHTDPGSGMTRCFIPARLEDNLRIMEQDPEYEKRLLLQPQHLIKALRWGDWDVIAGQVLSEYRRELHVILNRPLGEGWYRFVTMDWGFARPFSIGWWAVNDEGRLIRTKEWYGCTGEPNTGLRMGAKAVASKAWSMSVETSSVTMVADPACWSKDDDLPSIAETFASFGFKMVKATNDRKNGLAKLHEMLQSEGHDRRPMLLISENCTDWMRTVPYLTADPRDPEDINTELEDHCFPDGTMVTTTEGPRTIESMQPGECVITRDGPCRVLVVWHEGEHQTVVAHFSNGKTVEATPAHKVWVNTRGFIRIDEMRYGDIVMFREEPGQSVNQSIAACDVKAVHFVGLTQGTTRTVHDLSVEETHEYFADGLLVSNCYDDTRYACMSEFVRNPRGLRVREKLRAGTMRIEKDSPYDDLRRGL